MSEQRLPLLLSLGVQVLTRPENINRDSQDTREVRWAGEWSETRRTDVKHETTDDE
jgi:hypothetical protein